jgi:predicted RNA-binding Zn ribbon-like protein
MTASTATDSQRDVQAGGVTTTKDLRREGFPFRSGRLCLDFVATIAKRDRGDRELLTDPAQLLTWCRVADLPVPREQLTAAHVDQARELREAIHRLARSRVDGRSPSGTDIDLVNAAAQAASPTPMLAPDGLTALPAAQAPLASILSLIARDTIDLFTGPYALRIRECVAPDCSLFFVDRSRPGSRRWCAMAACGEKASSATYRQRHPGHR